MPPSEGEAHNYFFVGIYLAKSVFALHGVDEHGKAVLVLPKVASDKLVGMIAALPPCTVGMEACPGAHHWARLFAGLGHTVRPMVPKFVAPYRMSDKRGKNDGAHSAATSVGVRVEPTVRLGRVGRGGQVHSDGVRLKCPHNLNKRQY